MLPLHHGGQLLSIREETMLAYITTQQVTHSYIYLGPSVCMQAGLHSHAYGLDTQSNPRRHSAQSAK